MKNRFLIFTVLCVSLLLYSAPVNAATAGGRGDHRHGHEEGISSAAVKLKEDMRRLWNAHVVWTRSYIISALAGLEDQQPVLARLLKNQQDIGDAIKQYYGEAAGNKLAELLKEHIQIAGKVVDAAKNGNQADFNKYNKEWYKNSDAIAAFLSSANPNWTDKQLKDLLYGHLQLLTDQFMSRIKKDWQGDINAYDKGEEHILMLSDALSEGIIKQFPKTFH